MFPRKRLAVKQRRRLRPARKRLGVKTKKIPTFEEETKKHDCKILSQVKSLGAPRGVASVHATAAARLARSLKLIPDMALDIAVYDEEASHGPSALRRKEARRPLEDERPILFVSSPVCTSSWPWQALNDATYGHSHAHVRRRQIAAGVQLLFV